MKCKLSAVTKPDQSTGCQTAQQFVAYAARISNPDNQHNHQTAAKLLSYLAKNNHWSPFEMVSLSIQIQTTRDIARQILRHRSFNFQQFSQRYAVSSVFHTRPARMQDPKNRQNSLQGVQGSLAQQWTKKQVEHLSNTQQLYDWALSQGIAKEQARAVLPQGMTGSTIIMAGTLRSWIHYCQLRSKNGTQKQHMQIAEQCWKIVLQNFPSLQGFIQI